MITNYVFSNSWTYLIPAGEVTLGPAVTFQANAILKYSNNANLLLSGSITCNPTMGSPTILTSMYDETVGENIPGYATCPSNTATTALWIYYIPTNVAVSGMKIRWASRGIQFDNNGCDAVTNGLNNSTVENCTTAVYVNNGRFTNQNLTIASVGSADGTAGCGYIESITASTALADHITSGMEALTNGLTPSTAEYIFNTSGPATNVTLTNMYFNTGSWVYGLKGLSSLDAGEPSYTTNASNVVTTNFTYASGNNCTLITPQHALAAWHEGYTNGQVGNYYLFVGTNNVQYVAQVKAMVEVLTTNYSGTNTTGGTNGSANDIAVIEFASPVNSNVQPASILTPTVFAKLPYQQWIPVVQGSQENQLLTTLPCIACNYHKQAFVVDLDVVELAYTTEPSMFFEASGSLWFPNWYVSPIIGDSGSPIYVLIQGELVLMGAWHASAAPPNGPEAPWCGYDINTLNTTISNLCVSLGTTVYQVTAKDLSAFPDL